MYNQIKSKAASVPSTIVGGLKVHLGLVTDTVTYNRITPNNTYLCQTHPSPLRFNNGTAAYIEKCIIQNNLVITTFHEANHIDITIINQYQAALDTSILMPKINERTGVLNCNIINLMKYLFDSYGNISDQKLHDECIKTTQHQYFYNNPIANFSNVIHTYSAMAETHIY